jgi:hypothetical protein
MVFERFIFDFETIRSEGTFPKISQLLVWSVKNSDFSNNHMIKFRSEDDFFIVIVLNQKLFFRKYASKCLSFQCAQPVQNFQISNRLNIGKSLDEHILC